MDETTGREAAGLAGAASPRPAEAQPALVPQEAAELGPGELGAALEAVLFALNRAVPVADAAAILGRSAGDVGLAADALSAAMRGRGLMLQRHAGELQLVTRPAAAWAVQRALRPERPGRLSRPAMETLAIVAYRQPVTRAAIEAIRGVNCEAVLESLERRELVEEVGRQETPGRPRLYGTTMRFLQVVGLESVEDLPPLPGGEDPAVTAARLGLRDDEGDELATEAHAQAPRADGCTPEGSDLPEAGPGGGEP